MMNDSNKSFRSVVFLTASLFVLSACTEVKQTLRDADQSLQETFGTSSDGSNTQVAESTQEAPAVDAEELYDKALQARDQGRSEDFRAYLTQAAEAHHPAASYELAILYTAKQDNPEALEKAAYWMNQAAELGEPRALYLAGLNHQAGLGDNNDPASAAEFFAAAANQGHAKAQAALAGLYAQGKGVPQDQSWANRWYGKAAARGDQEAQFSYGVLLATGKGFAQDLVAAHGWLMLAAQDGDPQAEQAQQAVAKKLTSGQIEKSEAWARAFRPVTGTFVASDDRPSLRFVQQRLADRGYRPGPVDGLWGRRTAAAVQKYRVEHQLQSALGLDQSLIDKLMGDRG